MPSGITIGIDASRAAIQRKTGTERYSLRIIEQLIKLGTDQRFRIYLNQASPLSLALRAGSAQRPIPFPRLWTHLRLSTEIALHPIDALFIPAHVVPPVHPAATVVTIHDLGYLHEPESHTRFSRQYLDWSTRWSVHAARRVIAISNTTKRDLVDLYGVSPSKVTVIYHGIDDRFRSADRSRITEMKHGLGIADRFILFVGTIQPRKNLVRLVQAFNVIADQDPGIRLVMAGRFGWDTDAIRHAVSESPHAQRILLPGHVSDSDLRDLYAAADVVALVSLYEGFGLPALEALACGTPVVVSNRGSLPEIVGEAGEIVDPLSVHDIVDALRRALDRGALPRSVEYGRRHAQKFTWESAGRQTLETILDCYRSISG